MKWQKGVWTGLGLILFGLVVFAQAAELTPEQEALVKRIAENNRANRKLVDSFRCCYRYEITEYSLFSGKGDTVVKNGEYAFSGDKIYSGEVIEGHEDGPVKFVKNGDTLYQVFGDPPHRVVFLGKEGNPELKPPSPDPWKLAGCSDAESLDHLDPKKMRIESVEEDSKTGEIVVSLAMNMPGGQTFRRVTHYSEKKGYMPVKAEMRMGNVIHGLFEVEKVLEYPVDGKTFYVPAKFRTLISRGGRKIPREVYIMDESSVQVNPGFAIENLFEVEIRQDDQVTDKGGPEPKPSSDQKKMKKTISAETQPVK